MCPNQLDCLRNGMLLQESQFYFLSHAFALFCSTAAKFFHRALPSYLPRRRHRALPRRKKTIQRRYMPSTFISERTCKINTLCNFHLVQYLAIRCHSNLSYTEEAVLVCKLRISCSQERRCYVKKNSTRVRIGAAVTETDKSFHCAFSY